VGEEVEVKSSWSAKRKKFKKRKGGIKMKKYMVVHKEPELSWEIVERNWRKLAQAETAEWVKTYYNKKEGVRFCVWLALDIDKLKNTFSDIDVSWESMHEVEETKPDLWGEKKWKEHLEAEATADTLGD
jgi:hypothetical protein